jgi:hypothetical protein
LLATLVSVILIVNYHSGTEMADKDNIKGNYEQNDGSLWIAAYVAAWIVVVSVVEFFYQLLHCLFFMYFLNVRI